MKPFWTNPKSFDDVRKILSDIGLRLRTAPINNLTATSAPTSTDDRRKGYSVGSKWKNTTTGTVYKMTRDADANATWLADSISSHALLDGSVHSDTVADTVTRGSLIYANSTPKWDELGIGSSGQVLKSDGTDASWGSNSVDDLSDADTTTSSPTLNEVLKWDGSNWVPGLAGDTTEFTFSIDSFAGTQTDSNQLIGTGTWVGSGSMSFSATYSNAPGGMTALVTKTGDITSPNWTTLVMDPVTGAEATVAATKYPDDPGDTITFTLTQSADASTAVDTVQFNNTTRWGTNANGQGAQTEANLEALSEQGGPSESRSTTKENMATAGSQHVTFAYPDRLSDNIDQVQYHDGTGYVSAAFASSAATLIPDVQTGVTNVANSAGYSETFACVTSRLQSLTDGSNDFRTITNNTTAVNYVFWGEHTNSGTYTESIVEGNIASEPGKVVLTSISSQSMTVNAGASEYTYIAFPTRMGTISSIIIGGFESIGDFNVDTTTLAITNSGGYQENYTVVVSDNQGFADPTTMTVTI